MYVHVCIALYRHISAVQYPYICITFSVSPSLNPYFCISYLHRFICRPSLYPITISCPLFLFMLLRILYHLHISTGMHIIPSVFHYFCNTVQYISAPLLLYRYIHPLQYCRLCTLVTGSLSWWHLSHRFYHSLSIHCLLYRLFRTVSILFYHL
jgi:hypothetical protein